MGDIIGFGAVQELCEEFNSKTISFIIGSIYKELWDKKNTPLVSKEEILKEIISKVYQCEYKTNGEPKKLGVGYSSFIQLCEDFGKNKEISKIFYRAVENIKQKKSINNITVMEILKQAILDVDQIEIEKLKQDIQDSEQRKNKAKDDIASGRD